MNQLKTTFLKNPKIKFQSSNNFLGQQCFSCQGYGHVRSECPTYLKSNGKAMTVILSDDKESGHEFESDQDENFMTCTATAIVGEPKIVEENPFNGELSENVTCKRLTTSYTRL